MSGKPTFFELAEQLDKLISLQTPTPKQVDEVVELIKDEALERYFFRHLAASENLGWFEPLRQRGFFDTAPEPIEHEDTISYPQWPALWYLVAVAPKCPDRIIKVAERIHTQDPFLMLDLVRAARGMPPAYAAQMAPLVVRWADEGMKVEENVIYLATYLAQEDQWEAALTLVELILLPEEQQVSEEAKQSPFFFPRAVSKAERYFVQAFVERDIAFFIEHRPLEMLRIVQRNLERAIEIEERDDHDGSWIWRSAIEPHEQDLGLGEIKDLLVDAAVGGLEYLAEKSPAQAKDIAKEYLDHRMSIFRRLAIHLVRLKASYWPDLLECLFTDRRYVHDVDVYHEFWLLMESAFNLLPASVQNNFVQWILSELPPQRKKLENRNITSADTGSLFAFGQFANSYLESIKRFLKSFSMNVESQNIHLFFLTTVLS
jgi:hypothetical protein